MGIYIKGIEMPESCAECPMAHRNYRLEAEETQLACYAKGEWVSDDGERPVWCPLIELPPHGRLIDADAFEKEFQDNVNGGEAHLNRMVELSSGNPDKRIYEKILQDVKVSREIVRAIRDAPTIIEAEDGT